MTPDPPRPDHARHVYIPQNKPEYFMIPLLKGAIRRRVTFHGPPHMSNLAVLEKKRA